MIASFLFAASENLTSLLVDYLALLAYPPGYILGEYPNIKFGVAPLSLAPMDTLS
jgi:hypothetical protein